MKRLRIDVWSDIACPWCWIGKRRLETALRGFAHEDDVEIVWRSFELDPSAPAVIPMEGGYAQRLARKYRSGLDEANAMIARMTETAAGEGLDFRFDRIRPGNTFDAHRVLHLAHESGKQDAVKERFFKAYLTDGEPIGDRDVVARLAVEAGLDAGEVRAVLDTDAHAADVRADEQEAHGHGISGVPFFGFAGRYGVSGAQTAPVLSKVLERAWDETVVDTEAPDDVAPVCGPDGCG